MKELLMKCDICGKTFPESQMFLEYDAEGNLVYICRDCIKKRLGVANER